MKSIVKGFIVLSILLMYGNSMELIGKIKVKGSSPNTYIVIEDIKSKKSYKIINPQDFALLYKQNSILKIEANIIQKAIGPGFPATIKVISIQAN